jgi:hypothetical protein
VHGDASEIEGFTQETLLRLFFGSIWMQEIAWGASVGRKYPAEA